MYESNFEWAQVQGFRCSIRDAQLLPKCTPQNRQRTKDGNVSKLVYGIAVKHLVNDSIRCSLGNRLAGIEGVCEELTRHVACSRAHNEEFVYENALKGCGETLNVRTVWLAYWYEKETHPAAPFFELGEPFAKMGSVIEKVQSRWLRIRRKAKPADAAIGLLESVEMHRAEAKSRGDERANSSAMRYQ